MRSLKSRARVAVFVGTIGVGLGAACHAPVSITTPAGKTAYTADQIVLRVNELENAAIQANAAGALPVKTTRLLVEYCVTADQTLKTTPKGWQQSVVVAWAGVKQNIGPQTNPIIVSAMSAVDVALGSLGVSQ